MSGSKTRKRRRRPISPVDPEMLDRDIKAIRARHGNESVHFASEQIPVERIPLPLPQLMRITSGGIPIGRIMRIYGEQSTSKSMLVWYILAAAQQYRSKRFPKGLKCCLWNTEATFDSVFVKGFGVNLDELLVMEHKIIEDIAGSMEGLLGSVHLHVVDSASFATALEEIVGPKGSKRPEYEVQVGAHARAWKRAINRIHARMDKDFNVVIFVDHTGRDIQTQAEKPLSGKRMEFRSDLSLHLRRGAWLYYNKHGLLDTKDKIAEETGRSPEGQKQADGAEVKILVAKSRVCRPLRRATMRLDLNTMRFDQAWELAEASLTYDNEGNEAHRSGQPTIVVQSGAWYRPLGYPDSLHGMDKLRLAIADDKILQAQIRDAMQAAA